MSNDYINDFIRTPIPLIDSIQGRETVPIVDCGEPVVSTSGLNPERIRVCPQYYLKGYQSANLECYVRKSLAVMLLQAAELLPAGHQLVLYDGWRSTHLQKELYHEFRNSLKSGDPALSENELDVQTKVFVSFPSLNPKSPAPHLTGGAIDLSITNRQLGPLEMGTDFDHFGEESQTRYFETMLEAEELLSPIQEKHLHNRRLLFHTLSEVGFTNYNAEWWHFDYGNQFWAKLKRTGSIYGPIHDGLDIRLH